MKIFKNFITDRYFLAYMWLTHAVVQYTVFPKESALFTSGASIAMAVLTFIDVGLTKKNRQLDNEKLKLHKQHILVLDDKMHKSIDKYMKIKKEAIAEIGRLKALQEKGK